MSRSISLGSGVVVSSPLVRVEGEKQTASLVVIAYERDRSNKKLPSGVVSVEEAPCTPTTTHPTEYASTYLVNIVRGKSIVTEQFLAGVFAPRSLFSMRCRARFENRFQDRRRRHGLLGGRRSSLLHRRQQQQQRQERQQ